MRGSKFKPQTSPVRHPKPLNGSQRELSFVAYQWLTRNGSSALTGLPVTVRGGTSEGYPVTVNRSCPECSSLLINGTCSLNERH